MAPDLLLSFISSLYALLSSVRVVAYLPQILCIARDHGGAQAISLLSWTFWAASHGVTALYAQLVLHDALLAWMMVGNTLGCAAVVGITIAKRRPVARRWD